MQGKWIQNPQSDIGVIYVHGILSSGEKCWLHQNGAYWPELLKNQEGFEKTGIYVFTYETGVFSGTFSIGDIVDNLWEFSGLDRLFENTKKIVFVCHSMGGIVVRRFIVKYQQALSEKGLSVGLFLVASPSMGSKYANWLSVLTGAMGHTQAKNLSFSQQNVWLNDLDKDFQNLKSAENPGFVISGKELIEDKAIIFKKFFFVKQIVEPFSGARYFGHSVKIPGSDHSSIAKPENGDAIQHRLLCKFVSEMPEPESQVSGDDTTRQQGDQINISAGGDVVFAKDQAKAVSIKNS